MATSFDIPVKVYKRLVIKVVAEDLEEARHEIKKRFVAQRQNFEFEDIEDAEGRNIPLLDKEAL
jgi:hypothetical protein